MNLPVKPNLSRRRFLAGSAAIGGAAALGPIYFTRTAWSFRDDPRGVVPGSGKWVPTVCQGCTSWCVKQAYIQDGRVMRIRGHENSKIYGTSGCVRQNLALVQLYDPDRVRYPMKRTNPKKGRGEDPGFVRITWEEAMDLFAEKVLELRERGEPHKYVTTRGRYGGFNGIMLDSITKIIGSPNKISHSSICGEADKFGPYYMEGFWGYRQYDIKNSRYQLTFGTDPIAANRQVSFSTKEWGNMLDHAKVACVDPRFSSTAQKADEWLPIKPGQDAALALALAHVILVEGLWHKPFVGDFTDGRNRFVAGRRVSESSFEELYTHGLVKWWNLELKDRTPAWAAEVTDLPVEQILRVARDLGAAAPRVGIWLSRGMHMTTRGSYSSMSGHALAGLLGAADNEGGSMRFNSVPTVSMPDGAEYRDAIATEGLKHEKIDRRGRLELPALKEGKSGGGVVTGQLATSILEEDPYPIEVMYASWNNFAWANANPREFEEAFKKIPFMVYSTTNISETGMFADIILPSGQAMFERWSVISNAGNGYGTVGIQQPMVKVGDSRQDESEIPWLFAEALARKGFSAPLDYLKNEFVDPETGAQPTNGDELGLIMVKMATQKIWDPSQYVAGDKFSGWDEFFKVGVWNSDPYEFRSKWGNMGTKTGNFEFYSETLKAALEGHAEKHNVDVDKVLEVCNYEARGELAFVPHYEPPRRVGDESEYPMLFVDQKHKLNREGRGCNHYWYTGERDVEPGDIKFEDAAKFNPIDADKLGIRNGDDIRITSETGSITCKASVWEGVRPGCVIKSFGMGHWAYGRHVSREFGKTAIGGNNNELIPRDFDRLSGSSVFYGQIGVRVEKI
ncbi:MAG: molybdopterin-dependent oxidoreductase [Gammaproteobacteria bacterium]|nr:molybdopterin-dependent oxidoreductase [Gammaproteobacteria bacterium]